VNIWHILGIDATGEQRAIKRAYAAKLKVTRPDDDPIAFQLLSDAYERALAHARHLANAGRQDEHEDEDQAAYPQVTLAKPVRTPAGEPDPADVARTLWTAFLADSAVAPRLLLTKLAASDALVNMDVREQFELGAARYCASAACSDELREAVSRHFRWADDHTLIARILPQETHFLRAWLRAERAYTELLALQDSNPAVKALLTERAIIDWFRSHDAGFMRKMRALLNDIETYHPELLHFKLDAERVATWQRRAARKRYYAQTGLMSVFGGLMLAITCRTYLPGLGIAEPYARYVALAVMGLALLLPAVMAFTRIDLFGWLHRAQSASDWRDRFDEMRYRPSWQFGWLLPFAAASVALFIPAPSLPLRLLVGTTLLGCTIVACLVNWGLVPRWNLFIAVVAGLSFGSMLHYQALAFDTASCMFAALCALLILFRGSADLLEVSSIGGRSLALLRGAWMAGMALCIWSAQWAADYPHAYPAATWLWLFAGLLLTYPTFHFFFAAVGSAVLRNLVQDAMPQQPMLKAQPMSLLLVGLLMVTILMAFNMVQSRRNQHSLS
jgi:hypothetical protein